MGRRLRGKKEKKKQAGKQTYQTTSGANRVSACHPLAALIVPTFCEVRVIFAERKKNKRAPSSCLRSERPSLMNRVAPLSLSGFLIINYFTKRRVVHKGWFAFVYGSIRLVGCSLVEGK